jgi:hypothetical protein
MDVDNDNDQLSTIQDFQHSRGYNQQALSGFGLLRHGPHVANPWPQNDAAYHRTTFSTKSSLSVGFFLVFPMFYSGLDSNNHVLWDVPHRLELNKNPLTKRMRNTT